MVSRLLLRTHLVDMKFSKYTFILVVILIVGFSLRIWQLGVVPPSPNWDEVSLGYNAYSLLQTGRDEYGKLFPAVLRSYDDYKPAAYVYFAMPSVAIFGLNTFAVRFPAVVFATLAILGVYFLVKELLNRQTITIQGKEISAEIPALLSAFLLAISPWHIQFSRIAFESNVGVAFNIFAVLFFLVGLRKPLFLFASAFCFALTPSIYQSDKLFTPLLLLVAVVLYRKELFKLPKATLFLAILIGVLTFFPAAWFQLTDKQALSRAQGVSIFADQTSFLKDTSRRLLDDRQRNDLLGLFFDNRRVEFVRAVAAGYISHFDLNWLFVHGDLPRHHAPFTGLLYLWEFPFLLIGLYVFLFSNIPKKAKLLILLWFFAAPIPASFTSGVPHAVRALNFLPTFQIFVCFGLLTVFIGIKNFYKFHTKTKYVVVLLSGAYALFFFWNTVFYLNEYFVQQNYYTSVDWQYGYQQALAKIESVENRYKRIVVSNQPPLDQSYMFFLFYLGYPPKSYQLESQQNSSGGFRENHEFGKYEFRPINWDKEKKDAETLYVGRPSDFPDDVRIIEKVKYLNGDTAIEIVQG